jgi:LmbE family N-acetylglucosaminyl deacetylase
MDRYVSDEKIMTERVLVVAPHPDDETLGCGGTLLRMASEGAQIAWLIVTCMTEGDGYSAERIAERKREIVKVREAYSFCEVYPLDLPARRLDTYPVAELVARFGEVFKAFQPSEVFLPHRQDVHTDHRSVFDAGSACAKWFRYDSVRRVLAYETLSETDFALDAQSPFAPNFFVDITDFLDRKLEIMAVYQSEMSEFPFPRSVEAIRALATLRGASSGFRAAEGFQLLRERY